MLGLQAVFHAVPALYVALNMAGGLYLCWLELRIFAAASRPLQLSQDAVTMNGARRSFRLGFSAQMSNPKTAIVYASVFAALMPVKVSAGFAVALICLVFWFEAGWFGWVAYCLSAPTPERAYLSCKV